PRCSIFFSHAPAPTAIYTLSLHDALPISLSQDLLPLGLGERDPELAGEIEHHLLFEREQLSERARHLTHGSYHAGTRHDRRGERSEEHTSELQSPYDLVCRLLLEKKKKII